jgi:Tfp pilus assembly protein PilN
MINLLPPEVKQDRSYGRKNRALLGFSFSLVTAAVVIAGIMFIGVQYAGSEEPDIRASIEEMKQEISLREARVTEVQSLATRLEIASRIRDTSVEFSTVIPEIAALLPPGTVLNGLSLQGGGDDPIQLDVDLVSADLAPILIKTLSDSDLFEAADIASLTPRGASDDDTYRFTASVTASFEKQDKKAEQ